MSRCLRSGKVVSPLKTRKRGRTNDENINPSDDNTNPSKQVYECSRVPPLKKHSPFGRKDNNDSVANKVSLVKSALHTAIPSILTGRQHEITRIKEFLLNHVTTETPGSLYISGPPGTGKTAAVTKYLTSPELLDFDITITILNCMKLNNPNNVYSYIYDQLITNKPKHKNNIDKQIINYITTSTNMNVLVLDEIDQLSSPTQQILYSIYEWCSLPNSSLILISIANTLDMTDRMLPRLQSNPKTCPELLHFNPYTKEEIMAIIGNRLSATPNIFDKMAIQFCASKVSAANGDIRKALDICRRAIELIDNDSIITVRHIASVINDTDPVTVTNTDTPLQEKLVACSVLVLQNKKVKEPSFGILYTTYTDICTKRHLKHESNSEFVHLVNMLELKGIVKIKRSKKSSTLNKVTLLLQEHELSHALQDKTLISSVLKTNLQ